MTTAWSPSSNRGADAPVSVTDGTTTVSTATEIDFTHGGVVTDGGGGIAGVSIGENPITSGALPQLSAWISGTAQQNTHGRQVTVVLAPTGDASNNAATVAVLLSPDNMTFTTIATWSVAAAVNLVGALTGVVPVPVPDGWYIKLTIGAHATVAQSYYY